MILSESPRIELLNVDCMSYMKDCKDKQFDLAIVDPPYGIGEDWKKRTNNRNRAFKTTSYKNERVSGEYFNEVKRISKDQIIWGWNYYTEYIGSTNYLIVWDKQSAHNEVFQYSKCELASTTKRVPCNIFSSMWDGYRMGGETGISKVHPHQKPLALYKWTLKNYATQNDKIFDSHAGSFSLGIACHEMGFDCTATEIDTDYYNDSIKRFKQITSQTKMKLAV